MSGNLADLLRLAAAKFDSHPAFIGGHQQPRTWGAIDRAVDAGVASFLSRGLAPGQRLLVHLPNCAELAVVLLAGARAGLVLVPSDPTRNDLAVVSARVQATAVITDDVGQQSGLLHYSRSDVAAWWDVTDAPAHEPTAGGEDLVVLARASRSDKAVMLSHRALLAAVSMVGQTTNLKLRAEDRVLQVLPLFHLAGLVTAFLPLAVVGGAAVLLDAPEVTGPNVESPDSWHEYTDAILAAIRDHRVSVLPGAPALYRLLLKHDNLERSLASVRLMTSGASPLNPEDFSAMRARTGSSVWEGYGISEAASAVTSTLMASVSRPRSVGLPLPGIEVRIGLETSAPPEPVVAEVSSDSAQAPESSAQVKPTTPGLPWGESAFGIDVDDVLADLDAGSDPGPICVRGANLFSGYWPDGSGGPDADGWFVTADLGYLDEVGELHLIDRVAETITVAGFTVYPREVEAALLAHPYVRDVAVVGVPGRAGQQVLAVLVAVDGTSPTEADLTEHLTPLLPVFKRPTQYQVTGLLPRTELGRLDRDAVREQWMDRAGVADGLQADGPVQLTVVSGSGSAASGSAAGSADPETESAVAGAGPANTTESADTVVLPEPEVMSVSQLGDLGSRLPGIAGRSRRSTLDTDDDLFGEDLIGSDDPADGSAETEQT